MKSINSEIDKCVDIMNAGGLILYPTDTIWGIGCDPTNERAVQNVYRLKQRPEKKSLIILVNSVDMLLKYAAGTPAITHILLHAPEPTTGILPGAKNLAANLVADDGTIAIRIVKDAFCSGLIEAFRRPVVSTSANVSGEPHPQNFMQISAKIKNGVEYIVQHRQDDLSIAAPSKIVQLKNNEIIYLR